VLADPHFFEGVSSKKWGRTGGFTSSIVHELAKIIMFIRKQYRKDRTPSKAMLGNIMFATFPRHFKPQPLPKAEQREGEPSPTPSAISFLARMPSVVVTTTNTRLAALNPLA
tara:strand:- start:247 stop:582 length:336 start_codon:yes stop_codon:yes gene_type:complete